MKRTANVGDMVRCREGKYWVVSYALHRCTEGTRLLICFRDGVRRTFAESSVERVA